MRFYTTDDEIIGEFGHHEGILIPRGYRYWFESCGEEDLELLQFEASSKGPGYDITQDRVDYTPQTQATINMNSDAKV